MKDPIYFLLLGLGIGSLYAMMGASMVAAHKGSGVIHFGLPAMAQFSVFNYFELRNKADGRGGDFRLPWFDFLPDRIPLTRGIGINLPNIPVRIRLTDQHQTETVAGKVSKVGGAIGFFPAVTIALLLAVMMGLMVHFLVFRPLRNAAPLGKVVAAIAVSSYFIGLCQLHFTKELNNPSPKNILPNKGFKNFLGLGLGGNPKLPRLYPRDNLYLAAIALGVGALLWIIYKYTKFGMATRAAAGNEKGAVLLGYSPDFLAAANWVIASVVASFAAIIVGNYSGTITPTALSGLLGAFLAAMLVGGLNSIPLATLGGLGLGMLQTFTTSWVTSRGWFPQWLKSGVKEALPLVIISLVLFLRGRKLPVRGAIEQRRLPLVPYPRRPVFWTVLLSVLTILMAFRFRVGLNNTFNLGMSRTMIFVIFGLSLVVIAGYLGQISLGNLALAGMAAFVMARMFADGTQRGTNLAKVAGPGLPWVPGMLLGVAAAVVVGVLVGIPALRIRGVQLAVVTIAAAEVLRTMYFENEKATGLRAGVPGYVPRPTFFGWYLGSPKCNIPQGDTSRLCGTAGTSGTNNPSFVILCLVFAVACAWVVMNIRRGGTGRRFLSVRANERAAAAAGVNVPRTKLLGFGISAALAGVAGCLLAFSEDAVNSASFTYDKLFVLLTFAYLAGITSINGAIVGSALGSGVAFALTTWWFHDANTDLYKPIVAGVAVVFTAIIHPEGQAVFFQPIMRHAANWLKNAREREWLSFVRRYVPWLVGGALVGYLWFPRRVSSYRLIPSLIIPAWLGCTLIRPIVMAIYRKVRKIPKPTSSLAHGISQEATA